MSVEFRAADEPPKSRTDYWQHVVGEALGPLDLRVSGGVDVQDRLHVGDVGAVQVVELSHRHTDRAERAPRHIRQLDPELYKIDVLARGRGVVEHNGRQAAKAPGDLVLVDLSRPCRWIYSSAQVVAVAFPRALLPLRQDELKRLTGERIRGDRGIGALVSSLARQLPEHVDDYSVADQARVGTAMIDLLTAALAARLERTQDVPPDSRQRALLLRLHAFIEERLGDPGLSPAGIAAAHYISVRYLYKQFASEQTTPADWIRRRRLDRCRRDLLDPALRHTPVSTIAERWGFTSAAHFSRAFRAAYGLPPGEYRTIGRRTENRAAIRPRATGTGTSRRNA
jgi:AraC-like DNA-binding protein